MATTLDTLRRARSLLTAPQRWTKGAEARDEAHKTCGAWNLRATCWCATGAISRSGGGVEYEPAVQALVWHGLGLLTEPRESIDNVLANWNDDSDTTHADVLAVFDAAIERLEKEQAT